MYFGLYAWWALPYVVRTVERRASCSSTGSLEEAARTLGGQQACRTFIRVTMPQIAPGIRGGRAVFLHDSGLDNYTICMWFTDAQVTPLPILMMKSMTRVFRSLDCGHGKSNDPRRAALAVIALEEDGGPAPSHGAFSEEPRDDRRDRSDIWSSIGGTQNPADLATRGRCKVLRPGACGRPGLLPHQKLATFVALLGSERLRQDYDATHGCRAHPGRRGGDILIGGDFDQPCTGASSHIGMLFQNYALFPHMSVGAETVAFGLKNARREADRRPRAASAESAGACAASNRPSPTVCPSALFRRPNSSAWRSPRRFGDRAVGSAFGRASRRSSTRVCAKTCRLNCASFSSGWDHHSDRDARTRKRR